MPAPVEDAKSRDVCTPRSRPCSLTCSFKMVRKRGDLDSTQTTIYQNGRVPDKIKSSQAERVTQRSFHTVVHGIALSKRPVMFATSAILALALTMPAQHSSGGRAHTGHKGSNTTAHSSSTVKGQNGTQSNSSGSGYGNASMLYGSGYGNSYGGYGYNPMLYGNMNGYGGYGYNPMLYGNMNGYGGYGGYGYNPMLYGNALGYGGYGGYGMGSYGSGMGYSTGMNSQTGSNMSRSGMNQTGMSRSGMSQGSMGSHGGHR